MKIILAGSTGGIGSEVLQQCLQHPSITSIVALSRRPLPAPIASNPKLNVIIMEDFTSYSDSVLRQLDGAQACVWALGGPAFRYPDTETARKVNPDYTIAAAKAFVKLGKGERFNFVFCSGAGIERDQSKKLWFLKDSRRIKVALFSTQPAGHMSRPLIWGDKGEAENQLMQLEREDPDTFAAFLAQAGSVIPKNSQALLVVAGLTKPLYPYVMVDELAAAMIDVALNGGETQTLTNADLVFRGRSLLKRQG